VASSWLHRLGFAELAALSCPRPLACAYVTCYQSTDDTSSASSPAAAAAAASDAVPGVLPQAEKRTSQKVAGFLTTGK